MLGRFFKYHFSIILLNTTFPRFIVVVRDHLGEIRQGYNDAVKLVVHAPDQRPVRATIFDNQNGTYRLSWSPAIEGEHLVNVLLKDAHIAGSPFRVTARSGRNYR